MNGWDVSVDTSMQQILEWSLREKGVDRLLLSAYLDPHENKPVLLRPTLEETIKALFGSRLLERKLVRRWPGTELYEHYGLVFLIAFDSGLVKPMAEAGKCLVNWRHNNNPPLPEDPCLFREGDDWPVLVSVTHERDAWVLSEDRPPFCTGEPFGFKPENLLVPSAAEGFVGT